MDPLARRSFLGSLAAGGALLGAAGNAPAAQRSGRLRQGACRWCYRKIDIETLCKEAAAMGIEGIDLADPPDWPVIRKHGLVPSLVKGDWQIPDGFNRKENHATLEQQVRDFIKVAVPAGATNFVMFSGNRRGISDEEGLENCVIGLNRVKRIAEDNRVTICIELLNSKRDHKDYQADHTAWGAELCRRVNSPNVKLLYDIYHMQIMEGDNIQIIRDNFKWITHFHTGGNPGRHEIDDTQESNYRGIARAIADLGFEGFFSHEFTPVRDPLTSLRQAVEICTV